MIVLYDYLLFALELAGILYFMRVFRCGRWENRRRCSGFFAVLF